MYHSSMTSPSPSPSPSNTRDAASLSLIEDAHQGTTSSTAQAQFDRYQAWVKEVGAPIATMKYSPFTKKPKRAEAGPSSSSASSSTRTSPRQHHQSQLKEIFNKPTKEGVEMELKWAIEVEGPAA